jgi:hypothetical protein
MFQLPFAICHTNTILPKKRQSRQHFVLEKTKQTKKNKSSTMSATNNSGGNNNNNKKPKVRVKRPYLHQMQVDPQYAEKTWKLLRSSIDHIHKKNASGLSFEELYRYVCITMNFFVQSC